MEEILNKIKNELIPKFLRYIKENNEFPNILNRKMIKSLPGDTKCCMFRLGYEYDNDKETYNIYDICNFEVDFFKKNNFSSISPFGKNNKQCKEINDILDYIMFFIIGDVINDKYILQKNIDKITYIKNIVKIINK